MSEFPVYHSFYPLLIVFSNAAVVFFILWVMYRQRIFLKV